MRVSLNWLKKYVNIDVSNNELIRLIGARLVEVEGVIDETHKYDNIYVVRVEKVEKIPETHLSLCQIFVGDDVEIKGVKTEAGLVQVVCGAPNVREGMYAVWIAPGAIVPASLHEDAPFIIGKRKLRGFESNGMLAGADELDFGDDHSGIAEINPEVAKPGELLAELFELNDLILDIENKSLTHRPDCFGLIGFAREVAGILGQKFEYDDNRFKIDTDTGLRDSVTDSLEYTVVNKSELIPSVSIEDRKICTRYSAITLEKHGDFKKKYLTWMDTVISKSGMKPINRIVDVTNYIMLLTGQPLHAFDYDKFVAVGKQKCAEINVRLAKQGEKIVLLDQNEVTLNADDIVICSGDIPVALAGAMGGESTMIDDSTSKIIIESAVFSLYNLRKTQMAHGVFTEAITRFTKGLSSFQTLEVAEECAAMLSEGFKTIDIAERSSVDDKTIVVEITTEEINKLLGTTYDIKTIKRTLENVGFVVKNGSEKNGSVERMSVEVPCWRMDIHIKEDIIEEVGRLLGYDNIVPVLPRHFTAEKNKLHQLKHDIRNMMVRYGANEVLTYSFVSESLLNRANQDANNSYKIVNSISPNLQYIRQSIMPSLLDKAYINEKLPVNRFVIFEMNGVYRKDLGVDKDKLPIQKNSLGCVIAERKNNETAFYKAKKYVEKILDELGIVADYVPLKTKNAETIMFEPKRTAEILINGEYIGVVGEFKNIVRNEFKLAPYLAGFEVDLDLLLKHMSSHIQVKIGRRFEKDLTVTTEETYAKTLEKVRKDNSEVIIEPGLIYQAKGQETRNITFHITEIEN